jgi:hypothetical protein
MTNVIPAAKLEERLEVSMFLRGALAFSVMVWAAPGWAQVVGGACDSLNPTFPCSGNVVLFCPTAEDVAADTSGVLVVNQYAEAIDCGDILGDGMVNGVCYLDANIGGWCSMPDGEGCAFSSGSNNLFMSCGDATGPSPSQLCDLDTGLCASYPGGCSTDAKICNGTDLIYCGGGAETWPGAIGFDCTATETGGTGCSAGACIGLIDGSACSDPDFLCAAGLVCGNQDLNGVGTCTPGVGPAPDAGNAPPPDAGGVSPSPDAGSPPPPPPQDAGTGTSTPDSGTGGIGGASSSDGGVVAGGDEKEAPPGGYASGGCFARQHSGGAFSSLFALFLLLGSRWRRRT